MIFSKLPDESYSLVFDYEASLDAGEVVQSHVVYVNNLTISGTFDERQIAYSGGAQYENIFVTNSNQYDKDTVLVTIASGLIGSGYLVETEVLSNRGVTYTREIEVTIGDTVPKSYNEFNYRFLNDDDDVYILPELSAGFTYNNEYTVFVNAGISGITLPLPLQSSSSFWFTSQYCPLFANLTTIKIMAGPESDKFEDDTIYRLIHKNSIEVIDLYNASSAPNIGYTHWGCTPENVPYALRRYVECKTAYDLLNLIDMVAKTGVSQKKSLGDMSITYGGTPGSSSTDRSPKRDLYDCFSSLVPLISNGSGTGLNEGIRGLNYTGKGYAHPVRDVNHNRIIRTVPEQGYYGSHTPSPYWRVGRRSF